MSEEIISIKKGLLPLSKLYGWAVRVRNKWFDCGILTSEQFSVPVISIGNLAVGGVYLLRVGDETLKVVKK
ncbi:hypothetical protein AGMMS4957_07210 [Bacteroidia bacterium]|nr:hypothetical protein AGMMS4957_07210 [Bacteroidia bacterium]